MTSRYENPGPDGYIPKPLVDMGPSPVLDAMSGDSYNKGAWQHGGNWYFKNAQGRVQYLGKKRPKVKTVLKAPSGFNFRDAFGVPKTATGLKPKPKPATGSPSHTGTGGSTGATPAAGGATAPARGAYWGPWMQGFSAAGTPWNMNVDGGWTNETTGVTWKPGMPIPTASGSSTDPSMEIYKQLMSALTNMFQPTVPKV